MLGLVDGITAHGAFLPVVGFVMLPLVLVVDLRNRHGLRMFAHVAGVGLHAVCGAGGGRSHNAGIPRMCSLVHDGAAGELVPVVSPIALPLVVAHIAGAVSMRLVLFLAADAALDGMIRCAFLIAANNQYPLMPGGRDRYFFDRRLFTNSTIVVEIIIIATGTKPVGNTTVFVAGRLLGGIGLQISMPGLDNDIGLGDLLRASGILVQLAAVRIAALIVLNVAVLGAGSSLGRNLGQGAGVRGRCHARFNSNVKRNRSARHVIFCVITNQVNGLICHRIGSCGCISGNTISRRNQIFPRSNYSGIIKTIIRPHKLPARNINIVHSLESQDFRRNFSQFQFVRCACFLQRPYSFDSVNFIISGTGPTDGNSPRICTVQNNFSTCHFQFREVCGKCTGADKRQYHRHSQQERNALRENLLHQKCVSFPLLHSSIYHVSAL